MYPTSFLRKGFSQVNSPGFYSVLVLTVLGDVGLHGEQARGACVQLSRYAAGEQAGNQLPSKPAGDSKVAVCPMRSKLCVMELWGLQAGKARLVGTFQRAEPEGRINRSVLSEQRRSVKDVSMGGVIVNRVQALESPPEQDVFLDKRKPQSGFYREVMCSGQCLKRQCWLLFVKSW